MSTKEGNEFDDLAGNVEVKIDKLFTACESMVKAAKKAGITGDEREARLFGIMDKQKFALINCKR